MDTLVERLATLHSQVFQTAGGNYGQAINAIIKPSGYVTGVAACANTTCDPGSRTTGVYGDTSQTSAYGGYFTAPGTGFGTYAALAGKATSSAGTGVLGIATGGYGVVGSDTTGYGVYGEATSGTAVNGYSSDTTHGYGVVGTSNGTAGIGIYGSAQASTGTTYGVYGVSSSTGGSGIYGVGNTGGDFHGVATGVFGTCSGSGCYAGYFDHKVYINGTVYGSSDSRLKKDITPLSGALDQLLKLKGVSYEWREPGKHSDETGTRVGFIAQDVEKVFPNWVHDGPDGYKVLSVSQIEALQVEAIRQLKAENDNLRERVTSLEAGRRPMMSGFGEGWIGAGLMVMAGAVVFTRRKSAARPAV